MTREEAIEYLKRADTTVGKKIKTRTAEALEMAIKALEECSTKVIPIAVIKLDSEEVVEMVLEKIKNGEWIISSDSAEQPENPNPTKDIISAIEYWESVDEDNNIVKWLTELQEYRKAKREKAEQTDSILEDIKEEMECFKKDNHTFEYGGFDTAFDGIMEIINKYISKKEQK